MTSAQNISDRLIAFRERDKFSDQAWNKRGLNPSGPEICSALTNIFDHCTSVLIDAVHKNAPDKRLKNILKNELSRVNKWNYDTEEKEFICDLFHELAQILNIDFTDALNNWLYGPVLNTLLKIRSVLNPQRVLDTIKQTCPGCGGAIDTFIMRREEGASTDCWNIVRCKTCNEYSIISFGPGVKEIRFGNYELIEELPKEQFSQEQAGIRLEQLRYFRK